MSTVLNIAHRGFYRDFPDNTLEAFEAAMNLGVDGIELDVQETADGEFVVFHDAKIKGKDIAKLPLADVKKEKLLDTFEVPILEEVLELCRGRAKLLVELKKVHSLEKLLTMLRTKVEPDSIILISFMKDVIAKLWFLAPEVQTGIITAYSLPDPVKLAQSVRCGVIVVRFPFISEGLVERGRTQNLSIFVWGCPDIKAARKVLGLDIDGLITDFPDQVKTELS